MAVALQRKVDHDSAIVEAFLTSDYWEGWRRAVDSTIRSMISTEPSSVRRAELRQQLEAVGQLERGHFAEVVIHAISSLTEVPVENLMPEFLRHFFGGISYAKVTHHPDCARDMLVRIFQRQPNVHTFTAANGEDVFVVGYLPTETSSPVEGGDFTLLLGGGVDLDIFDFDNNFVDVEDAREKARELYGYQRLWER